jgi:hypothetical protein
VAMAEGFYEWKKDEKSKAKQPYYIHYREEDRPLFFAALCDRWEDAEGASRFLLGFPLRFRGWILDFSHFSPLFFFPIYRPEDRRRVRSRCEDLRFEKWKD